jgi:hypothetical protein
MILTKASALPLVWGVVGPGLEHLDSAVEQVVAECVRTVVGAVVGEYASDVDPGTDIEVERSLEEGDRCRPALVGTDLRIGEARVVVDRDMNELPALPGVVHAGTASVDPVPSTLLDPPELLHIEVHQVARFGPLVADRWLGALGSETAESVASQHRIDRGACDVKSPGQPVRSSAMAQTSVDDPVAAPGWHGRRQSVRP